ncbi:hypothetical protein AAKU55_005863, partial [Oxalobacteraceae bacterium GrIS 1.11]
SEANLNDVAWFVSASCPSPDQWVRLGFMDRLPRTALPVIATDLVRSESSRAVAALKTDCAAKPNPAR